MRQAVVPLKNVKQTLKQMKRLAIQYATDVAQYASLSLQDFFNLIKNIPYRFDLDRNGKLVEILQRPLYTLNGQGFGGDCDDKAICMASWAYLNGIPFRFKAVGKKKDGKLHHVYAEFNLQGKWLAIDPTYKHNTLFYPMANYQRVVTYG